MLCVVLCLVAVAFCGLSYLQRKRWVASRETGAADAAATVLLDGSTQRSADIRR